MLNIEELLVQLGLTESQIKVYLAMLRIGVVSGPALSKVVNMPKTTVYHCIDDLLSNRLVVEVIGENGKLYHASSPENLRFILLEQEKKVKIMQESLPEIFDQLSLMTGHDVSKSRIKYYSGIEGLKQVTWNSSKAKDKLRIFEIKDMSVFLNYDFCELTRLEFLKNKVKIHELTNEVVQPGWTDLTEIVRTQWELRYIDPKELKMEFEMLVYNDVYTMYNYQDKEIFCAEIYNERLARMQKQIFDFIWLKGRKFRITDKHGASKLIS